MRYLKYILIALLMAEPLLAGVEVHVSEDALELVDLSMRRKSRIAMLPDGEVWLLFTPAAVPEDLDALYFTGWGTSYTHVNAILTEPTSAAPVVHLASIGDTAYFAADPRDANGWAFWGFCKDGSVVFDTIADSTSYGNWDGRPCVGKVGSNGKLSLHVEDDPTATPDSTMLFLTTTFPVSGDWTAKWDNASKFGDGWASPILNSGSPWGILLYENGTDNDLTLIDTLGFTTLSTGFFANSEIDQEGILVIDSDCVAIQQPDVASGTDSLYVFNFRVTDMAGTPGLTYLGDTTVLLTAADNPDGFETFPILQHLSGTDTVIAYYRYCVNGANDDSVDIAYHISGDKGQTWGSRNISRAAIDGDPVHNLQVPPLLFKDGSGNVINYAGFTASETTDDSLYIWVDTLVLAGTPPIDSGYYYNLHIGNEHKENHHGP